MISNHTSNIKPFSINVYSTDESQKKIQTLDFCFGLAKYEKKKNQQTMKTTEHLYYSSVNVITKNSFEYLKVYISI